MSTRKTFLASCFVFVVLTAVLTGIMPTPVAAASTAHSPSLSMLSQREFIAQTTCSRSYTVQSGDWLSRIATRFHTSWSALASINHLSNPNLIFPGEVLCLSGSASPPQSNPTPPPTTSGASFGPCHSSNMWGNVGLWNRPSGCYGSVYGGAWWNGAGDCFALAQYYTHGRAASLPIHWSPIVGAVIFFEPGVYGASPVGHYGMVVGISHGWMLILNQNYSWNGGGYGRQNYRYVPITSGMYYRY